jgi:sugar/nucleoside kinase (ribokinase family)
MRDDVGAGDVFAAAFFIELADGAPAAAAAAFANAAAAVRIAGDGPEAIGDRAAIEARAALIAS